MINVSALNIPTSTRRIFVLLVAIAISTWLSVQAAPLMAADSLEVHDFETQLDRYLNKPVTVVGRFRSASGDRLRLAGSAIEFRVGSDRRRLSARKRHLALTGQLVRGGAQPVFRVDSFVPVPSEAEDYLERRKRLSEGQSARLYQLARWLAERARWYSDGTLRRLSAEAYREAWGWQQAATLRGGDAARLWRLAALGEILGAGPSEIEALRHAALQVEFAKSTATPETAQQFAQRVRRWLPGIAQAQPIEAARQAAYWANPGDVYAAATTAERLALNRLLWSEIASRRLMQLAAAPRANVASLLELANRELPDRPELIRSLRLADVRGQAQPVGRLSRARLEALQRELVDLGEAAESQLLIEHWLAAKHASLGRGDAEGMVGLANDYLELTADRPSAARLYLGALELATDYQAAAEGLRGLGYQKLGGVWQAPQESADKTAEETAGELALGMSDEDVERRLRRPDRIARTLSAQQTNELWIYAGPPRLHVYLRRSLRGGPAFVTAIIAP